MPKELISAVEVLWQAAMTQSEQQLINYKAELDAQHEKIQQEQLQNQQQVEHIKQQLAQTINQLAEKNTACHTLQTDCAVIKHQLEQKDQQINSMQHQYEARLQRTYQEKDELAEKNQQLLQEIKSLQEQFNIQDKTHQIELKKRRIQQEKSENRWLLLIDQARQETKEIYKKLDTLRYEKDIVIETIKNDLAQEKQQSTEISTKLSISLKTITELETRLSTNKSGKEITDILVSVELGKKLNGRNIRDKRLQKKFKFIDIKKSK